jgi:hypothetical protein
VLIFVLFRMYRSCSWGYFRTRYWNGIENQTKRKTTFTSTKRKFQRRCCQPLNITQYCDQLLLIYSIL